MSERIISEIDTNGRHCACYSVQVGHGKYRETVSFNAFFYSVKKHNRSKNRLYTVCSLDEMNIQIKSLNRAIEAIKKTDDDINHVINCFNNRKKLKSIWEFYEIIGYDYRKKKYVN